MIALTGVVQHFTLDNLLREFNGEMYSVSAGAIGYSNYLFGVLAGLELALFGIFVAIGKHNSIEEIFEKFLVMGILFYIQTHFGTLAAALGDSMSAIGGLFYHVPAGSGLPKLKVTPDGVLEYGLKYALGPFQANALEPWSAYWMAVKQSFKESQNVWDIINNVLIQVGDLMTLFMTPLIWQIFGIMVANLVMTILIVVLYVYLAIKLFMALIEFRIVFQISYFIFPFSVFGPTAKFGSNAINAIFGQAVHLGITSLVVSMVTATYANLFSAERVIEAYKRLGFLGYLNNNVKAAGLDAVVKDPSAIVTVSGGFWDWYIMCVAATIIGLFIAGGTNKMTRAFLSGIPNDWNFSIGSAVRTAMEVVKAAGAVAGMVASGGAAAPAAAGKFAISQGASAAGGGAGGAPAGIPQASAPHARETGGGGGGYNASPPPPQGVDSKQDSHRTT